MLRQDPLVLRKVLAEQIAAHLLEPRQGPEEIIKLNSNLYKRIATQLSFFLFYHDSPKPH